MKQETGSNSQIVLKKVSIQLALDGHSFSVSEPIRGEGDLRIEVLTPRTMLVPQESFDKELAAELLAANGMPLATGECAVWSEAEEGIVAVMGLGEQIVRNILELNIQPHYTTPLLHTAHYSTPTIWFYRTGGLLYIKVYDRSLRFAEVISAPTNADVLYFANALGDEFQFRKFQLHIAGTDAKKLSKQLDGWFEHTTIDNNL